MVLSNLDQLDAFKHQPEGEMLLTPEQLEKIAVYVKMLIQGKQHLDPDLALDQVLDEQRVLLDRTPEEKAMIRESAIDFMISRNQERFLAHAARTHQSHEDEHSHEVFVNKQPSVSTSGEHPVRTNSAPREGYMEKWEREHDR